MKKKKKKKQPCQILPAWSLLSFGFHFDPVHITPDKFENAALVQQLGLPSTLICHETKLFDNNNTQHCSNLRNLKTSPLRFSVDGTRSENEAFRK